MLAYMECEPIIFYVFTHFFGFFITKMESELFVFVIPTNW